MKAVILAGGLGTRLSEETEVRPKPMVEIGAQPILWHIMKIYSASGINDFIVCCGYKGHVIKEYFANYFLHRGDVTFDLEHNRVNFHRNGAEAWRVTLIDTGDETMTGGRLKRVADYIGNETFCFTYGDGLADLDMNALIAFHRDQGVLATLTAVQPPGRYGAFQLPTGRTLVTGFREKPLGDGVWVNGGFFVLEPEALEYIEGDGTVWEREPVERLAREEQLGAYRHTGFWMAMDTLRDRLALEQLWKQEERPPWKIW